MNSRILLYLCIFIFSPIAMFAQGDIFQDLTYEQALQKAKEENKKIFIDLYTGAWENFMGDELFKVKEITDFLNQFICVKYEVQDANGQKLIERFQIRAFPTFLFMNADNTLQHQLVGGDKPDKFLVRLQEVFDDEKAIGVLKKKYELGCREKSFMISYVEALFNSYSLDTKKVANELFNILSPEERLQKDYWPLFSDPEIAPIGSPIFNYIEMNYDEYIKHIGYEVDAYLRIVKQL